LLFAALLLFAHWAKRLSHHNWGRPEREKLVATTRCCPAMLPYRSRSARFGSGVVRDHEVGPGPGAAVVSRRLRSGCRRSTSLRAVPIVIESSRSAAPTLIEADQSGLVCAPTPASVAAAIIRVLTMLNCGSTQKWWLGRFHVRDWFPGSESYGIGVSHVHWSLGRSLGSARLQLDAPRLDLESTVLEHERSDGCEVSGRIELRGVRVIAAFARRSVATLLIVKTGSSTDPNAITSGIRSPRNHSYNRPCRASFATDLQEKALSGSADHAHPGQPYQVGSDLICLADEK